MHSDAVLDLGEFLHHSLIDLQASCGIQDDDVFSLFAGIAHCGVGDTGGLLSIFEGKNIHSLFLTVDLQLLNSRGPVDVQCHQKGLASFGFELPGQLGGCGRFTCALAACHHNHCRASAGLQRNLSHFRAHEAGHLFIDDLDDHLGGIESAHDIRADRAFLYGGDKVLYDFEIDIGLEQGHLDLSHSRPDVRLRQTSLAAETTEHLIQFFSQTLKCHSLCSFLFEPLHRDPVEPLPGSG